MKVTELCNIYIVTSNAEAGF